MRVTALVYEVTGENRGSWLGGTERDHLELGSNASSDLDFFYLAEGSEDSDGISLHFIQFYSSKIHRLRGAPINNDNTDGGMDVCCYCHKPVVAKTHGKGIMESKWIGVIMVCHFRNKMNASKHISETESPFFPHTIIMMLPSASHFCRLCLVRGVAHYSKFT